MAAVVTFDAGQTLVELDLDFLARRLGERGVATTGAVLAAAAPAAWAHYDEQVQSGGAHPWRALMGRLLDGIAGPETVDWLWAEQPRHNLWRRPIAPMVELARELRAAGVIVAVLSNSEGHLATLLEDIGIADPFAAVIDSGVLGIEKPDPRIFAHALEVLGLHEGIHIGDSWAADIVGATRAGWRSIWYGQRAPSTDPRIAVAADAAEVRRALVAWGLLRSTG